MSLGTHASCICVSVAILAQAEHLLRILCNAGLPPMESGMMQCDICGNGTPSHDWKLPLYWKWVWYTHAGGEWKCTCKVCRWHLWRDSYKLEPHDNFRFLLAVSAYSSFFDPFQLPSTFPLPSTLQLPSASFSFLWLPPASSASSASLSFLQLPSADIFSAFNFLK